MTEQERKEKAYETVNSFICHYKEDLKNASPETMSSHKQFIIGMIAGFNLTEIITDVELIKWLKGIQEVFSNMGLKKN